MSVCFAGTGMPIFQWIFVGIFYTLREWFRQFFDDLKIFINKTTA